MYDLGALEAALSGTIFAGKLHFSPATGSTNTDAMEAAAKGAGMDRCISPTSSAGAGAGTIVAFGRGRGASMHERGAAAEGVGGRSATVAAGSGIGGGGGGGRGCGSAGRYCDGRMTF